MKKTIRTMLSLGAASGSLLAASNAFAVTSSHAVAFVHGTGDQLGNQVCSGSIASNSYNCVVGTAVSKYWGQTEIDTVRGGRNYVVVGFHGGSATPWKNASPFKNNAYSSFYSPTPLGCSAGEANCGTAYEVATQIATFVRAGQACDNNATACPITQLAIVTHSGGANVVRYILQHPTTNSDFQLVANTAKEVETIAAPSKGTYLADRVFVNDGNLFSMAASALAALMGFKDDGTYFIQTANMSSQNGNSAYFGVSGFASSQGGVPFYASGGTSTTKCAGITLWGHCLGVTYGSLGGSSCDSFLQDVGLTALHNFYLNANDASTARNKCSDGFISCASSQAIGTQFGFSTKQDHNQSRRTCNNEAAKVASQINNGASAFDFTSYDGTDVPVSQWDSCGFSTYGTVGAQSAAGCSKSDLGDGWCDSACIAVYGHDAVATFDAQGRVTSWGTTDDCTGTQAAGTAPQGFSDTNDVWGSGGYYAGENGTYTPDGTNWYITTYNGKVHNGDTAVYYTDPNWGSPNAAGRCPQSWIGDGWCDECVLAEYGDDGNDCLPGKVRVCSGVLSASAPLSTTNNPVYNELGPTSGSVAFNVTNTASATQNTQNVSFTAAGGPITIGTDSLSACKVNSSTSSGDTYIRLYNSAGTMVASNDDDGCSVASKIVYTAPAGFDTYTLKVGCYSSTSCSGTAAYTYQSWVAWNKVVTVCSTNADCASGITCANGICATNVGNGTCDIGECAANNWSPCSVDSDCSTGTCASNGYCSDSGSECNANTDCTGGATCYAGACTFATADCTTTTAAGVTQSLCR